MCMRFIKRYYQIMKIKFPRGKLIAVFGPDGSGKSTIYHHLKIYCERESINLSHFHWRPGFLPYSTKISIRNSDDGFTNPHFYKGRNTLVSTVILFYILLDFLLGYWFVIRPKLNSGVSIYYERYYHDVLLDEVRYNLSTPRFLRTLFSKFVFEPDHIIILSAPAEIIYARKKELTLDEIIIQQKRLSEVFEYSNKVTVFNVEKNLPELSAQYVFKILRESNG